MQEFDLLNSPLEGANLIEASAGTGKTYTLSALYLRFILEKELSPEQILVVTFTEAATKELRDRIRKRLRECVDAFSSGAGDDSFLSGLISKTDDPGAAARRFTDALRDFDRAAIFTIHGFCQRILHENAFESSSLFDTELVTEQEDLKREIIEDFWRIHFYTAPHVVAHYALQQGYSPQTFLDVLRTNVLSPDLKIVPSLDRPSLEAITGAAQDLSSAVDNLAAAWSAARDEVEARLRDPALSATSYGNPARIDEASGRNLRDVKVAAMVRSMDNFLALKDPVLPLPDFGEFALFTPERIVKATKKKCASPAHAVFPLCEAVAQKGDAVKAALDEYLLFLKIEALRYLEAELPERKKKQNIQHFDDLLLRLKRGLDQPGGEALAAAVREKHKAALIDEFQDTDSIQYAIFHNIFRDAGRSLFLIGDPKQAIYSFRGADIFTYMEASRRADHRYTLGTNWRSEPDLVEAVNTLFNVSNPFVYPEITFKPASATSAREPRPLRVEGRAEAPMRVWLLGAGAVEGAADGPGKAIRKPDAQRMILEALAAEISRLLRLGSRGEAVIGEDWIRESDLAVLVRTNDEARMVQEALSALRIPSVLHSTEDLFDSAEALEMEWVLSAVAEPHQEGLVRAALATDMMGVSGVELAEVLADERIWEGWIVKFRDYFRSWHDHGFIRMFRLFMLNEAIRTRLVSFPDGERRITNLLHLSEVLHHESVERKLGPAELLKWLSEQRDPESRRSREHQLRLESDENAVKIITIHKSKGLEYPIVFCPFSWGGSRLKDSKAAFLFHDENDARKPTLDLGSPQRDANRALAEKEALAENMRLLYVALTRAKKRCYFAWGPFNTAETSSLAYLLHHRGEAGPGGDVLAETEAAFGSLSDESMLQQLREIEARSGGRIRIHTLPLRTEGEYEPSAADEGPLVCRRFKKERAIDRTWRISSFSSLASGTMHRAELPDRDEASAAEAPKAEETEAPSPLAAAPASSIFAFPRGATSGVFLHDVLEHLDFTGQDPTALDKLVGEKLEEYGFEVSWRDTVSEMIRKVLSVGLVPYGSQEAGSVVSGSVVSGSELAGSGPPGDKLPISASPGNGLSHGGAIFSLSSIADEDRLNELEFTYPVAALTPGSLREAFRRHDVPEEEGASVFGDHKAAAPFAEGLPRSWAEEMGRLSFNPVKGFMKGFIDLVFRYRDRFYLLDWKSNHLGNAVEDYSRNALAAVMARDYYVLQYHLYTVALDRYLSVRLSHYSYDDHFGGVYYVFLRGVEPEKGAGYGVFSARPRKELVRALNDLFDGRLEHSTNSIVKP
jgi:exodeoxyribonuclease V beta subunit